MSLAACHEHSPIAKDDSANAPTGARLALMEYLPVLFSFGMSCTAAAADRDQRWETGATFLSAALNALSRILTPDKVAAGY